MERGALQREDCTKYLPASLLSYLSSRSLCLQVIKITKSMKANHGHKEFGDDCVPLDFQRDV
jgi:hypothetical protein